MFLSALNLNNVPHRERKIINIMKSFPKCIHTYYKYEHYILYSQSNQHHSGSPTHIFISFYFTNPKPLLWGKGNIWKDTETCNCHSALEISMTCDWNFNEIIEGIQFDVRPNFQPSQIVYSIKLWNNKCLYGKSKLRIIIIPNDDKKTKTFYIYVGKKKKTECM